MFNQFFSRKILFSVFVALTLASCSSTTIDSLDPYESLPVNEANIMPTKEQLNGKKLKLVIFPIENTDKLAERSGAGQAVTNALYEYLAETNAEFIERSASAKYKDEIRLSQDSGAEYTGPAIADFVLDGQVDNAGFTVSYEGQQVMQSILTGEKYLVQPQCHYSATLQGSYSLRALPSLKLIQKFPFSDTKYLSVEATETQTNTGERLLYAFFSSTPPKGCIPDDNLILKLVNSAASAAVKRSRTKIQNIFAPKGYISAILRHEDKYLARINIGTRNGLQQDQQIKIYTIHVFEDALTKEETLENRLVAKGKITNLIGPNHAYVLIDNEEEANKIKIGDFVKVHYALGSFEALFN